MFIRFISGEIDEDSHVSAGLFCAAGKLLEETRLPEYQYDVLRECLDWFRNHLECPYKYRLKPKSLASRSVCWFRPTAHLHLRWAWQMVTILEDNNIFIRIVKCHYPG